MIAKRWLIRLAAVLALTALAACETMDDTLPPRISLANVMLAQPGLLRQDLNLDLRIANPNNVDIPIEGLTFRLDLDGQPFAEGMSNERVTVPRLSEVAVPVKGSVDTLNLVRQILTLGQSDTIRYRISGFAYVGAIAGARRVPYERDGSLSLVPPTPGTGAPGGLRMLAPQ